MDPTEKHEITRPEEAARFIDALADAGLLFHFDDDPADCLAAHNLSSERLEAIAHNVDQVMAVDWSGTAYECPFDYVIRDHS